MVKEAAIELAVPGPFYRKAANTLETLLGYLVMSHKAIRQHLLNVEVIQKEKQPITSPVLFVEVDGKRVTLKERALGRTHQAAGTVQRSVRRLSRMDKGTRN